MDEPLDTLVAAAPLHKTLLLVDSSADEETFLHFRADDRYLVFDAEAMNKKRTIVKKKSVSALLEEARFMLCFAMKHGKVLVVRLGKSMADFKNTFNDTDCPAGGNVPPSTGEQHCLPKGFTLHSGQHLLSDSSLRALYRRKDIVEMSGNGDPSSDPHFETTFKIILTTAQPFARLDDFLFNASFGLPGERADYNVVEGP